MARRQTKKVTRGTVSEDEWKTIHKFAVAMERGRFADYVQMLQSPKKLLWNSFISGVGKGFGAIIGATVVVGITLLILSFVSSLLPEDNPVEKIQNTIEEGTTK